MPKSEYHFYLLKRASNPINCKSNLKGHFFVDFYTLKEEIDSRRK